MNLTPELKAQIDAKSVGELLRRVRFDPVGSQLFTGESGDYWMKRLSEFRLLDEGAYVAASKSIGWGK